MGTLTIWQVVRRQLKPRIQPFCCVASLGGIPGSQQGSVGWSALWHHPFLLPWFVQVPGRHKCPAWLSALSSEKPYHKQKSLSFNHHMLNSSTNRCLLWARTSFQTSALTQCPKTTSDCSVIISESPPSLGLGFLIC